ncbi:hypothetical protein EON82_06450 [bacterium]|nr:MAG: hypothetical protein EON82_06450 [bacterium]
MEKASRATLDTGQKESPTAGWRQGLIEEFKIRAQVAGIEASTEPPMRKARLILRLARRIRAAAKTLGALSVRSFREGDALRGARMREATDRLIDTHAELRAHADKALHEPLHERDHRDRERETTTVR